MEKKKRRRSATKPKAKTSDIVGAPVRPPPVPRRWRKHYSRLLELREQVLQCQTTLSKDALEESPTFSSHIADAATDTFDRDWALSMLSSEQNALYQIEQALDRIRQGIYGLCEVTGKPIEPRRLEAIPWARFGVAAEKDLEQKGERKLTRLGPREAFPQNSPLDEDDETEEPV